MSTPGTDAPIGIFDSGFGGLTVARAIVEQMPNEDVVYLGDTARAPYGPRPLAEVRAFALEGMDHLVGQGVKALVIACNSASSAVLRDARERYTVPVVDVILPAARRAVKVTKNNTVGLICTAATATSQSYDDALTVAADVTLVTAPCPRFVPFVEEGVTSGPELEAVAREYLAPIQSAGADTLILGCTHYPLLKGMLSYVLGDGVQLVSSSDACAAETYKALAARDMLHAQPRQATRRFLTTGNSEKFEHIGSMLLGGFVTGVQAVSVVDPAVAAR